MREIAEKRGSLAWLCRQLVDQRAQRHGQIHVRATVTGPIRAHPVLTAFSAELGMKTIVDEGVGVRAGDDVDRAAVTAVAAARAAARHAKFPAEGQASAPAPARFDVNFYFVNEHQNI